jgi:hypothetical protein
MSFSTYITNYHLGTIYYPGDTITGRVHLHGPIRDENLKVYIKLKGTTSVTVYVKQRCANNTTTTPMTDNRNLFEVSQLLYQGRCHLERTQNQSWDFSLTLPQQKLPPSFCFWGYSATANRVDAKIKYELKARAYKSSFFSIDPRWKTTLQVRPQRDPTMKSQVQSLQKLVNSKGSCWNQIKKCFRKFRWVFTGCFGDTGENEEPESMINLVAVLPSVIGLGEVSPLSIEFTNDSSTKAQIQGIKILGVTHSVTAKTRFHVPGVLDQWDRKRVRI